MHDIGKNFGGVNRWRSLAPSHLLLTALAITLLMQVELAFAKSINWDEFFHFSDIHRHLQGRHAPWLQVPFVWLFSWVTRLPGDNITHIQIIRLFTILFELIAIGAIIGSARRFSDRGTAVFCGLLYATGGYVFLHAFSLRADMIAAAFLMAAIWIGICRPLRALEIAAMVALVALAFISTIKSALYAPALLGVALYRTERAAHRWLIVAAASTGAVTATALMLTAPLLPEDGIGSVFRDVGELGLRSVNRMFSGGLMPQPEWFQGQILRAPVLAFLVPLALAGSLFRRDYAPRERVLFISLLLPLCTVAVYRNAFPYHYAFILPPAMIAVVPTASQVLRRFKLVPPTLLLALAATLSLSEDRSVLPRQRIVQDGIHEIFTTPVTYIDDCGIVGDFPRAVNHYASGWGLDNYRRKGSPTYSMALEAEPVPALLADQGPIRTLCFDFLHRKALLPKDEAIIRENYIPHWGNVFVAGKEIPPGELPQSIQISVPGVYTVEGGAIVIDGSHHLQGSVISLSRGPHVASGVRLEGTTLRWGDHLPRPRYNWPEGRIFTDF
ncbi:MAG: hypothetical protein M3Y79_12445 [Pseudomonadota bacterium]|nr:hypothetical protein [Pseudomonadota bacterium]